MILSPEQQEQILRDATKIVAERMWEEVNHLPEQLQCVSLIRAAAILDVSPATLRRMLTEYIDLGERDMRLTMAQLRELIERRRVKADKQTSNRKSA